MCLHATAPGDSDPQCLHGFTLPAFGTASATFRKSPRTGATPLPRRVLPTGTSPPGAVGNLLRERTARPLRPFRSCLGSQRGGPRAVSGPAAGRRHRCMRSLSGNGVPDAKRSSGQSSVLKGRPPTGTVMRSVRDRIMRQSRIRLRLQSSFRFRMPWISDFGSVFFRFPLGSSPDT